MDDIKAAFGYLNSFKRNRAKRETELSNKNQAMANYYELLMYKDFDQLELSLRGIQKENRNQEESSE